jgi:cell division protease FtsH
MPSAANVVARVASTEEGKARIEARLAAARLRARTMLTENRHVVEALRDALLDRHELIGDEIIEVINDAVAQAGVPAEGAVSDRPRNRRYGF